MTKHKAHPLVGAPGRFTDYQRILQAQENHRDGTMELTLRFPTRRYAEDFWRLNCATDLMELGVYPNFKEMTESFAAYRAARLHIPFEPQDPEVNVVVVGDGATPRTAVTFAFRSAWNCFSIDPNLHSLDRWKSVKRLVCIPSCVEDSIAAAFGKLIIVAPHSHASLPEALSRFDANERHVIALPCCKEQVVPGRPVPDIKYDDWGIWSPARSVMIWRDV